MRRSYVWLSVLVAFVIGLAPGLGLFFLTRASYVSSNRRLLTQNADLTEANQRLKLRLESAETSVSALTAQVARLQLPTTATQPVDSGAAAMQPSGPPKVVARAVTPAQVAPGAKLTLTIKLTGKADKARMRITGPGGFDKTYFLAKSGIDGGAEVWESVINAPKAAGTYAYYGIALAGTQKYPMPGTEGFTFTVK